jgi:hypothetical protein
MVQVATAVIIVVVVPVGGLELIVVVGNDSARGSAARSWRQCMATGRLPRASYGREWQHLAGAKRETLVVRALMVIVLQRQQWIRVGRGHERRRQCHIRAGTLATLKIQSHDER